MSLKCPYCSSENSPSVSRPLIVARGYFVRKEDQSKHQRFHCKSCKKSFSLATFHPCYRQRKRTLNPQIFKHLVSRYSQRRLALNLGIDRKTVVRKFMFLGLWAYYFNEQDLKNHRASPLVHPRKTGE